MADRELFYGQNGSLLYSDTDVGWYPAPYDALATRGALCSQAYMTDAPVNDLEIARRMDVDGTPGVILKAGADGLPADSVISEDATNVILTGRNFISDLTGTKSLGSATVLWAGVFSNAFRMPTGAGAGKIIKSDADGDFEWDTLAATFGAQTANYIFAGPAAAPAATPTFRSLVNADFPATLNPTFAGLGATPIITSYVGPHAIGGAIMAGIQLAFRGSLVSSSNVAGLRIASILTPGGTNQSAFGALVVPTQVMLAGQVHPQFVSVAVYAPTITTAAGASVTEATTLRVSNAPTAGVSNYAVHVVAGASKFGALTASLPVVTDADKVLASLAYTGATSFRKNLGLETDDSPTFAELTVGSLAGIIQGAAGVLSATALGAANLKFFMNAAGTAPEWATGIKIGRITKDTADASADEAFTGIGFKPSNVLFVFAIDGSDEFSIGVDNATLAACTRRYPGGIWSLNATQSLDLVQTASITYYGKIKTLDVDGFTITWVKVGAKTGSAILMYMAFR